MTSEPQVLAGWYPDPLGLPQSRWWDGLAWTEHVSDARRPLVAAVFLLIAAGGSAQQLSYSSGQRVVPAYEGWEKNPDGSINLLFGYMNQNWEEEIDIPVADTESHDIWQFRRAGPHPVPKREQSIHFVERQHAADVDVTSLARSGPHTHGDATRECEVIDTVASQNGRDTTE